MVRNYKKKGEKGKWNEEDMSASIKAVKVEKMTVYGASKQLKFHRKRYEVVIGSVLQARAGWPTTLREDEQAEIVETCQIFAE